MKTFDELTDAEVLALTDAEIERYIDLECARAGVPLLPPEPGPEPEKPQADKDVTLYEVGGHSFREQEQALRVAAAINSEHPVETKYASGPGYQRIVGGPADEATVTTSSYFSRERWDAVGAELIAYEEAKQQWERERDEYRKAVSRRNSTVEWVVDRISTVREGERQRERYANLYLRYLGLADGDEVVARKFLLDAEPEAAKYLPEGEEEL